MPLDGRLVGQAIEHAMVNRYGVSTGTFLSSEWIHCALQHTVTRATSGFCVEFCQTMQLEDMICLTESLSRIFIQLQRVDNV